LSRLSSSPAALVSGGGGFNRAGFGETSVRTLPHDIINYRYVSSARA
jgi:hypothetical protein